MSEPSVTVTPFPGSGFTFDVIVRDPRGESRHRVTIEANEAERWAKLGAAFELRRGRDALSPRSRAEGIDHERVRHRVVRRYFPEFDEAFPGYLVRLGGEPGRRA